MYKRFITIILSLCAVTSLNAQTFYVSTTGVDGPGRGTSLANAARTLRYTANTLVPSVLTEPVIIKMAPGQYDEFTVPYYTGWVDEAHITLTPHVTDSINTFTIEALDYNNMPIVCGDSLRHHLMRMDFSYTTLNHIHFKGVGTWGKYNAGGLRITADHVTIRNCIFTRHYHGGNRSYPRSVSIGGNYITITNNVFYGSTITMLMLEFTTARNNRYDVLNNVFIQRESHRDPYGTWPYNAMAIGLYSGSVTPVHVTNSRFWNNITVGITAFEREGNSIPLTFDEHTIAYNMYDPLSKLLGGDMPTTNIVMDSTVNSFKLDPLFMDIVSELDGNGMDLDLHVRKHSPAIDRGSPQILDPDGGRSDMGVYGGPWADKIAPNRVDRAHVDHVGTNDNLVWDYASPPADFDNYGIYRSTDPYFAPGTSNLVDSISNVNTHAVTKADGGTNYYYKINVWDDDTLGGGYRMYDTIPPVVTGWVYQSNGTSNPADDTLFITFSERIVDPFVVPMPADLYFNLSGAGNLNGARVTTGARLNDDKIIITGFSFDGVLSHGRSRIAFDDPNDFLDYAANANRQSQVFDIDIYNVHNANTGNNYTTLGTALAAAGNNQTIIIMDNGLYAERNTVSLDGVTVKSDTGRAAVLDGTGGGTVLTVTGDNVTVDGLKFTGTSAGNSGILVSGASSGTAVRNCIAFGGNGNGFALAGNVTLEHCVAYNVGQSGIFFNAAGICRNNISTNNGGANFQLNAATTEAANCSYAPGASDQNYEGWVFDPKFAETANQWAGNYLSLQNSSPCINMAAAGVTTDINGIARPFAGAADIGAYEVPYSPLALASFTVTAAPSDTLAGDNITVTVTAIDQFGARFYTYANDIAFSTVGATQPTRLSYTGTGLADGGSGAGTVSAGRFNYGMYSFQVAYELAGDDIQVRVEDTHYGVDATGPSISWDPAAIGYLKVEPGASGQQTGQPVSGVVPTTSGLSMHVSMYDQYDNYRGDTSVTWSQIPGGTLVPATGYEFPGSPTVSYEFRPDPTSEGTSGRIIATLGAFADTSDLISIIANPGRVRIVTDAAGNKATELNTFTMQDIDTLVLYAAAYDSADNYIGNLVVDWNADAVSGTFTMTPVNASNIQFMPTEVGLGYIHVSNGMLNDSTGYITVEKSVMDAIRLNLELVDGSDDSTVNTATDFSLRITAYDEDSLVAFSFDSTALVTWRWGITDTVNEVLGSDAVKPADGPLVFSAGYATASGFRLVEVGVAVITVRVPGHGGLSATVRINVRDGVAPKMMQDMGHTRDADGDGRLDRFEIFFNEPLRPLSATGLDVAKNGFSISGSNTFTVDSITMVADTVVGTVSRALVTVFCTNSGVGAEQVDERLQLNTDTGERPEVSYSLAVDGLVDLQGNPVVSDPVVPADGAGPVITKVEYFDPDGSYGDPEGDYMQFRFSEPINAPNVVVMNPRDVFAIKGIGRFGRNSRLTNSLPYVNVMMGSVSDSAVEPVPVVDSAYIVNSAITDLNNNAAHPAGLKVAIHMEPAADLVTAFYAYPSPIIIGDGAVPSGAIDPGQVSSYQQITANNGGGLIKYRLNEPAEKVTLMVFTLAGRPVLKEVYRAGDVAGVAIGENYYYWNGYNQRGRIVESGGYLLKIIAATGSREQAVKAKMGVVH